MNRSGKKTEKTSVRKSVLGAMIHYVELGLPIIPCNGKIPLIKDWQNRQPPNSEEVEKWANNWSEMNVGLALGSTSGIIGIDIDGEAAISRLKKLSKGDIPTTWSFQTPGGGKRYLYKVPDGVATKKYVETLEGDHSEIALLGDGQQTILPPSIHPNGGRYKWYKDKSYKDIELADAPQWMLDLMTGKITKKAKVVKQEAKEDNGNISDAEEVFERLSRRCTNFKNALEIQKTKGLAEGVWFMWVRLLVSAGHGDAAMEFSKLSTKHDERSEERVSKLIDEMPNGGAMIRCITFSCDECDVEKCFCKVNENEEGNITNSPGSFIKDMTSILPPSDTAYRPYLEALETVAEYDIDEDGNLCGYDKKGNPYTIANFVAKPELEIIRDDGISEERSFRIEGLQRGQSLPAIDVSAADFLSMNWVMKAWGIGASIRAGMGKKDQCRDAIQNMALDTEKLRIFTHLGWQRLIDRKWVYLHSDGCVGSDNITVEVEKGLQKYVLPSKVNDLKKAVNASKALLEIAPKVVTIPLLALCYLAPLNDAFKRAGIEPNFLVWLYGGTGTRKTTTALLFLCHFGKFNGKTPPASFKDTANAIERKSFATKDTVLLIDDYHPESSKYESEKMAQIAQRILRMFGDRIGRGRLKSTIEFQKEYPPRGEAIVTGEDIPVGQSSVARFLGVEILQGDVDLEKLTEAQNKSSLLAEAMLGYIKWLIPQMEELPNTLSEKFAEKREHFQKSAAHGRLGEAAAWLAIAFEIMLEYFKFAGVCSEEEIQILKKESEEVLTALILKQNSIVNEEKPVEIFVKILKELMISGKIRVESLKQIASQDTLFTTGETIGWKDDNFYYLRPEVTYNAVNKFLASRGQKFPILERTLWKQLDEAGLIQTEKSGEGKVQRCPKKAVPKKVGQKETERLRLLHLKRIALDSEEK
ncbi:bifunctional DNA primase/polymerase [Clostridium scatologenes]|uniref:TOPRIM domain-containing protein n=1 Tax=Clostridium scatologenes TaxID=1548 RepID=A0A0E3JQF9_CLOSL|nr:bifunctional DNA primase/polymerase [Clostridium scatologenes]AKA70867.1 TOPRIM domain-containing protein [Clostridium scatologenes]